MIHQFRLLPILAARFNKSFAEIVPAPPSPFWSYIFFPSLPEVALRNPMVPFIYLWLQATRLAGLNLIYLYYLYNLHKEWKKIMLPDNEFTWRSYNFVIK